MTTALFVQLLFRKSSRLYGLIYRNKREDLSINVKNLIIEDKRKGLSSITTYFPTYKSKIYYFLLGDGKSI
ncbi:MAG: hypothetical protein EAZ79_00535 [Oscillatoriales cyanobacterium]|nr:MAG: hypothetical protein EAZ79_00535 [Oscillatoriales cyanobacterium]